MREKKVEIGKISHLAACICDRIYCLCVFLLSTDDCVAVVAVVGEPLPYYLDLKYNRFNIGTLVLL